MKTKYKYRKGAQLDNSTTEKIIDCFVEDIPAIKVGKILGINRKTIDNWYLYFREIIYEECRNKK
ncbi:hypothetical protein LAT59_01525 [Candidatus Gracilibacteria bacterium]|nr:hypothetical protein [Candidatus Gracilibacteria bacterium]